MNTTTQELLLAKDTAASVLEQLGLSNYVFDIEPVGDHWQLQLEYSADSGWQTIALEVNKEMILAAAGKPPAQQRLLASWKARLEERQHAEQHS